MNFVELIRRKRDGGRLSAAEINFLVGSYADGSTPDYQMSAFLMSAFLKGLNHEETFYLTEAMIHSGEVVNLRNIAGVKVDKHSTGGVGDGTSLVLAPLAAACGVVVPMMSGRSLGHTGGTLDKLESIPGFKVSLTLKQFKNQLSKIGVAMIGQTESIVPADKKMYALRDVTATVESKSLICSSILSKKFAEGVDALLLDVKTGSGAFISRPDDALELAKLMKNICLKKGIMVSVLVTSMDNPLGFAVGNSLEVEQAIETLKGRGPKDFNELTLSLASKMIQLAGIEKDVLKARKLAESNINNGRALDKFIEIVKSQGGDPRVVDNPEKYLPRAKLVKAIRAESSGFLRWKNVREIGMASAFLGASRFRKDDKIDNSAGIVMRKKAGDSVERGEPLAYFYLNDKKRLAEARKRFIKSIDITDNKPVKKKLILKEV